MYKTKDLLMILMIALVQQRKKISFIFTKANNKC